MSKYPELEKRAVAHFTPQEGSGPRAVWHTWIYCDLNIEGKVGRSRKDEAAATRIRERAQKHLEHAIKATEGMTETQIVSWLSAYIMGRHNQ